jgi:uncharacterized integral membrane protein
VTEEKKGVNWRAWIVGALIVLVAIVALQNSQDVKVDVLFITTTSPLIVTLLALTGAGLRESLRSPLPRARSTTCSLSWHR